MNINDFVEEVHELAKKKGWWDKPVSFADCIANFHGEISEAWEAYRDNEPVVGYECPMGGISALEECESCGGYQVNKCQAGANIKPVGIAVELADCVIRIMDWFGAEGLDLEEVIRLKHEYNKTRTYRHGGKLA